MNESKATNSAQQTERKVQEGENMFEQKKGFFGVFNDFAGQQFHRLKKTIIADLDYTPKNQHGFNQKEKIFKYLKMKYMTIVSQSEEYKVKKFTDYDPACGTKIQFKNLQHMKEVLMKMKTNTQAAKDARQKLYESRDLFKANFLQELAFQFDKQRYCSIAWGLLFGAVICSTIYSRGSLPRQTALFLTCGHGFGQVSYHYNIDKYFDSVNKIFLEDAIKFEREQQLKSQTEDRRKIKGKSYVDD